VELPESGGIGIIEWIGTSGLNTEYNNPIESERIIISLSPELRGFLMERNKDDNKDFRSISESVKSILDNDPMSISIKRRNELYKACIENKFFIRFL